MSLDELISFYRANFKGVEIVIPGAFTHYSSLITQTVFSAKT
jgi:hypothetical protein